MRRTGIDGVPQLLVGQLDAGDVDDFEPFEFLAVVAVAHIDEQLVVEYPLLLVVGEVVEIHLIDGELTLDILTERYRPLLTVEDFEPAVAVLVLSSPAPIHHIEGKPLRDGPDYLIPLLRLVDELTLVGRSDIEATVEPEDAAFFLVDIALDHITDL